MMRPARFLPALALLLLAVPAAAQQPRPGGGLIQPPASGGVIGTLPGQLPGQFPGGLVGAAPGSAAAVLAPSDPINQSRQGLATAAEAGAAAAGPIGDPTRLPGPATIVYGAGLFTRLPGTTSDAPNPNVILAPGDRVSITVWGFVEGATTAEIDINGNVFIPNVGPVRLAGVRAGDVQTVVESEVRRIYSTQVQVYANALSTGPLGVFVTGFVRLPGRHLGARSDSVLDFLLRAGGVDPSRGSYRSIELRRNNRTAARIDLYRFLQTGELPDTPLQAGDTLVVAPQGAMVGADGAVRNNFLFEVAGRTMPGAELIRLAAPLPSATNAVIRGSRNGQPFARYLTVRELGSAQLMDQDQVTFITDAPAQTIRVQVEGSRLGPSVLIADRNTSLCTLLDHIAVDPALANTRGVFILRPGLAAQQQRVINEAMDRLERQLFLTVSTTTGVAEIRASEANLVANWINRARRTQPEGRLVVMDRTGTCAEVRLDDNDTIVIPDRVSTVLVSGEVLVPQAVVWRPNMRVEDYFRAAGGLAERGDNASIMIRKASGELVLEPTEPPEPGDELIALPRLDPKLFQLTRDLFNLIFQTALSARVFTN